MTRVVISMSHTKPLRHFLAATVGVRRSGTKVNMVSNSTLLSSCLVKCQYRNAYWNPLFWMRRKWRVLTIFLGDIFDPVMQMIRTLFVFVGAVSTMYITIGVWVHVCFRVQTWISCTTTSECIMKDARTEPCHLISEHASGDMVPLWSKFPPLPLVIALVPLEMFVI